MLTSTIVCPHCAARLKVTGKIEEGKRISCPKCSASFAFPAANGSPVPASEKLPPATKTLSPSKDDDSPNDDSQEKDRPPRKKKKKLPGKARPADTLAKLIFAAAGILVYIVGAAGIVLLIGQLGPPPEDTGRVIVARPGPSATTPGSGMPVPRAGGPAAPPPATPVAGSGTQGAAAPGDTAAQADSSQQFAAGKDVFGRFCVKCHTLDAASEPQKKPLNKAASDPSHTVEWFITYIADPNSQKPGTKMPAFAQKLDPQELQAVAEYMASLK